MTVAALPSGPVGYVLDHLTQVKARGSGWKALCPAHEDSTPSLDIDIGRDGRVLLICRAGCTLADIVASAHLEMSDLFLDRDTRPHDTLYRPPPAARPAPSPSAAVLTFASSDDATGWPVVASFDYCDADGALVFQVQRKEPPVQGEKRRKSFTQRTRGVSGWVYSLKDIPERPLFRLPELLEDLAHERTILLVEGEKDCNTARSLGFPATTHNGGANGWRPEYARQLANATVVIIPDNDAPGREWAATAAEALLGGGATVRMLALPIQAEHADLTDWITAGGSAAALRRLLPKAIPWEVGDPVPLPAAAPKFRLLSVTDLENLPPMDWLVGEELAGVFPAQSLVGIFGAPGGGKSFIAADLACTIASRRVPTWFGNTVARGPVLYVAAEGGRGFRHRIIAWRTRHEVAATDLALSFVLEPVNLYGPDDISHILRTADLLAEPPVLVVFDTVARSMVGGEENSAQDMGLVIDRADRIKRETGATVALVHHSRKDGDVERGSGALRAGVDTLCLVREDEDGGRVVSCEKQKDAEPFDPITFYLATVGDSCVVSAQAPAGAKGLTPNQRAALTVLADVFAKGATSTEWKIASGVADRSFYRVRVWLVQNGYASEIDRGNSVRYSITSSGHFAINARFS